MAGAGRLYLDNNATAPLRQEAADAMTRALAITGNPSSVHSDGRAAYALVERAREEVAALVGARGREVIFTSGGSEAASLALSSRIGVDGRVVTFARLLVCATEHHCTLSGGRFPADRVERLPVDRDGLVDLAVLDARLREIAGRDGGVAVVAVQLANNETGIVQHLEEVAVVGHGHGGVLVCDAVQAAGKLPVDQPALGADLLILSAHKLGGPQGVGALVLESRISVVDPLIRGGGQERGVRAGTANLSGIAGFGAAAAVARAAIGTESPRLAGLRDGFEAALRRSWPDAVIFGAAADRLANTSLFSIPGLDAQTLLMALDLAGVSVSSGSACSSGKVARSHVLDAMGVPCALAEGAIRVSLGWASTRLDLDRFVTILETSANDLHARRKRAA